MNMMRKMQKEMERLQAELSEKTIEVSSGGGAVSIVITGDQQIKNISIDPTAIDPEEAEILEDLLITAINEAIQDSQKLAAQKLGSLTGGMKIPGITG